MENKCNGCGAIQREDDTTFTVGTQTQICYECATAMACEAKDENREIEILENGNGEEWRLCQWCDDIFPASELKQEVDLGNLCDSCVSGIASRGEKLFLEN